MMTPYRRRYGLGHYGAAAMGMYNQYQQFQRSGKAARDLGNSIRKSFVSNKAPAQPLSAMKRKRPKKRPRTKKGKTMRRIKSDIKSLKQSEHASLGQLTQRNLYSARLLCINNAQNILTASNPLTATGIENVLANMKFFDPANPSVLVTGSGAVGTYQRNVLLKTVSSKMLLRNNYQTDVDVKVYLAKVKDDTNLTVTTAWTNSVTDGSNLTAATQLGQYPTDYNQVKDLYSLSVLCKASLSPGQSITCSHSEKDIEYDSATVDSHNLEYQREYKSFQFLVVITGALGHDTSINQQAHLQAGVDIEVKDTFVVKYNAGVNISYTHVVNNMDTAFTNAGVQSHQPIPDNIGYSIA